MTTNRSLALSALVFLLVACGRTRDEARDAATPADARDRFDASAAEDASAGDDASAMDDAGAGRDAGQPDAGPTLGAIGDPCASADDCLSAPDATEDIPACLNGETWPNGSAWENGYCAAPCATPPAIEDGVALAQRDCPAGSLCVPLSEGYGSGICLAACETDADCRAEEGYFCRRDWLVAETPNGVCMGWHCRTRGCPGSAVCGC